MASTIVYDGYGMKTTCTQCGRTAECKKHSTGFFGNELWFCSSGCLNSYARDNNLEIKSKLLIGKAW